MQDDTLRVELEEVQSELAAAKVAYASLGAKIAGLEARREALMRALPDVGRDSRQASTPAKPRTEAIVSILMAADAEMAIKDVIAALHAGGRDHETYDNVAADLAYLAERGRIARVRRGFYTGPDRIVIPLTAGSLNNSYIPLGNHLGFFPADAIGPSNARDGMGAILTLHFAGRPDPVETDIAGGTHKDFRRRGPVGEFFAHHKLQAGDKIAIEKQSDYEYRVLPSMQRPGPYVHA